MKQPIPSIFNIIQRIVTQVPSTSEKVTFVSQQYAQIKLNDGRLVTLRHETYKKVPNALVLRGKDKKIVCAGFTAITKELEK